MILETLVWSAVAIGIIAAIAVYFVGFAATGFFALLIAGAGNRPYDEHPIRWWHRLVALAYAWFAGAMLFTGVVVMETWRQ